MKRPTFYYGGYRFEPLRKLTKAESANWGRALNMTSDRELNLSTYAGTYTHKGFYEASTRKSFDLFRCVENGKTYIPCTNELFWCAAL